MLITGGDAEDGAQRLTMMKALGDRGGVDRFGHRAAYGPGQHHLVDLLGAEDLDGQGHVVRVVVGGGLE